MEESGGDRVNNGGQVKGERRTVRKREHQNLKRAICTKSLEPKENLEKPWQTFVSQLA